MIKEVHLKGFRGIANGIVKINARINLLVGPNNSGKSTILEALYLASTAGTRADLGSTEGDFFPVLVPSSTDMLGLMPMARMWQRHQFPQNWEGGRQFARWDEGSIRLNLPQALRDYNLLTPSDPFSQVFPQDLERQMAMLAWQSSEQDGQEEIWPAVQTYFEPPWEGRRFAFTWFPPFTYRMQGLGGWYVVGTLPSPRMTLFYDSHVAMEHLPAALVERGYGTNAWLRRIGHHFGRIFDLEDVGITFDPRDSLDTRVGFAEVGGQMHPIDTWGDGARHVFKLLAPLLILSDEATPDNPGLLLWEDPELFMNPQALERLLREVVEIISDKPIQVFITTQSIEVLAFLTDMLRRGVADKSTVMAFRLALRDGRLLVSQFAYRNLLAWLEEGADPRLLERIETPLQHSLRREK